MTFHKNLAIGRQAVNVKSSPFEKILRLLAVVFVLLLLAALALRAQSIFSGELLRKASINYVSEKTDSNAEIAILGSVGDEKFAESGVTARCSGETFRGQSNVALEFLLNGKIIRRKSVPLYVKIYREVAVATEHIQSGTALSTDKYAIRKQDVSAFSDEEIPAVEELQNAIMRRSISKGGVITRSSLLASGSVRKGETVTLRVLSGAIVLTAPAIALNDAAPGETVRISRNGATSILTGTLADDSVVEITMKK